MPVLQQEIDSNLHLAPPVKIVDGLTAVPIDIQQLDARVVFDLATLKANVEASMMLIMGESDGHPVFDLRQDIQEAYLNEVLISTDKLQHHDFGGGVNTKLRIIDRWVTANSSNTLRLIYELAQPQSPKSQPIGWDTTLPCLYWDFWFSDLNPARYLEMWFPANLIYDQFSFNLEIELKNTTIQHILLTNGQINTLGQNHWKITFPERFSALSPMLVLGAEDRFDTRDGTMALPDTGTQLQLKIGKLKSTVANLANVEDQLKTYIADNITTIGPYLHGDKFTAFIWEGSRSMEYEGAVTSNVSALEHEVFHSWFARGVKPATQNDSWIDEGWTQYCTSDSGGFAITPFDMSKPPVTLCSSNPFNRITPMEAYDKGSRFFAGLAAAMGLETLRSAMSAFYREYRGQGITTAQLESYLICRSSAIDLTDYFHRFVYGFSTPAIGDRPDLYLRDAEDDPGVDPYVGVRFWDSPDLWVRNTDDGGTVHQNPEYGQDNWFYARVRNRGTETAQSFVVTFNVKAWAGTHFVYPEDYLPCIAAVTGFTLEPGTSTVVKAKWPAALVPPVGTLACWLATVCTPTDIPLPGNAGEHNNLAEKNIIVVDLLPNESIEIPFWVGSRFQLIHQIYRLEVRRPPEWSGLPVSIVYPTSDDLRPLHSANWQHALGEGEGEEINQDTELHPTALESYAIALHPGILAGLPIAIEARSQIHLGLKITVPANAQPGDVIAVDLVQRRNPPQTQFPWLQSVLSCFSQLMYRLLQRKPQSQVVGGITVQIHVR